MMSLNRVSKSEGTKELHTLTHQNVEPNHQSPILSHTMGDPPFRGQAAIVFPYLNLRTGTVQPVYGCRGCGIEWNRIANGLPRPLDDESRALVSSLKRKQMRAFPEEGFLAQLRNVKEHESGVGRSIVRNKPPPPRPRVEVVGGVEIHCIGMD
jgi:hypothetical protein